MNSKKGYPAKESKLPGVTCFFDYKKSKISVCDKESKIVLELLAVKKQGSGIVFTF